MRDWSENPTLRLESGAALGLSEGLCWGSGGSNLIANVAKWLRKDT